MTISTIELILATHSLLAARSLGAASRHRAMGGGQVLMYILVVAAIAGAAGLGVYLINRALHHWRHKSHLGLFHGLCREHGLGRRARGLLKQVAGQNRLNYPCRVLTEPQWVENAARSGRLSSRAKELKALHKKLFC
ncbi:MAG: hypothetical protein V3V75_05135 [Thermoguttaceae bacterium]